MKLAPLVIAPLTLVLQASGQLEYDAEATSPAPSPTAQGWGETISGGNAAFGLSPDPSSGINAWQVDDSGPGRVVYDQDWEPGSNQQYEIEIVMRPLAGTLALEFASGYNILDNYFRLEFEVIGNDVHILRGILPPLICSDATDGYHRFRLHSGYGWCDGFVFYDDVYLGVFPISGWGLAFGPHTTWGSYDGLPGRARFRSVRFRYPVQHPLGFNACGPAVPHSGAMPARIEAFGSWSVFANDVRLDALDLPTNQFGYFLVSQSAGFVNPPGSQGNLCLAGNIGRFNNQVMNSGPSGSFSLLIDLMNLPTNPPSAATIGETWNFQAWYRDVNPAPTSNFTDMLRLEFP